MWNRVTEKDTPFAPFAFLFAFSLVLPLSSYSQRVSDSTPDDSSRWLLVNPKSVAVSDEQCQKMVYFSRWERDKAAAAPPADIKLWWAIDEGKKEVETEREDDNIYPDVILKKEIAHHCWWFFTCHHIGPPPKGKKETISPFRAARTSQMPANVWRVCSHQKFHYCRIKVLRKMTPK